MKKHDAEKYPEIDALEDRVKLHKLVVEPIWRSIRNEVEGLIEAIDKEKKWLDDFDPTLLEWRMQYLNKAIQQGKERQEAFKDYTLQEYLDLEKAEKSAAAARLRAAEYYNNAIGSGVFQEEAEHLLHPSI